MKLGILIYFGFTVCFLGWFEIKLNNQIAHWSKKFFTDKTVREIALHVVQRNSFLNHSENILIVMLGDNDADTQNISVSKVFALCKQIAEENEENKIRVIALNAPKST